MAEISQNATRVATQSDIPAVVQLEQRTAAAAHWGEEQYNKIFHPPPRRIMLVIEEAHLLRGFLVASAVSTEWEIENVVVDDAVRRRGLGMRLIGHLVSQARSEQAQSIFLEVRESNGSARALYEKAGFVQIGRRSAYFRNPTEDAILYRLSL
jgi:[ribosomal protein S18]-alanine N-acetyltransferase